MTQQTAFDTNLVGLTDTGYRKWVHKIIANDRKTRPTDPFAADYNRELRRWERFVQCVLGMACPEAISNRVLAFRYRTRRGTTRKSFREIDFVSGNCGSPLLFSEIKIREKSEKARSGWPQLRKTLAIARTRWPAARGICVNVAIGDLIDTECHCSFPTTRIQELSHAINTLSKSDGANIWIQGRDLVAFGVGNGVLRHGDVEQLVERRAMMLHPARILEQRATAENPSGTGLFDAFLNDR